MSSLYSYDCVCEFTSPCLLVLRFLSLNSCVPVIVSQCPHYSWASILSVLISLLPGLKLISLVVFVTVEVSASLCLCRWISKYISLCSCLTLSVFLHVRVSLGLCHQVWICVTSLFLCPYRSLVLYLCVLFSSPTPCLHVIMSMCFYLSVLDILDCGFDKCPPGYFCVLCVLTPLLLCLDLCESLSFHLYAVMSQCLHISHCVPVPGWPHFCLPASLFVTGTAPQNGDTEAQQVGICFSGFMSLILSLWLPAPLFVCLHALMSILFILRSLCFHMSLSLFTHPCLCPRCCLSVCDSVPLVVSIICVCLLLCHGILFGSFIQQIFTKHLLCARP